MTSTAKNFKIGILFFLWLFSIYAKSQNSFYHNYFITIEHRNTYDTSDCFTSLRPYIYDFRSKPNHKLKFSLSKDNNLTYRETNFDLNINALVNLEQTKDTSSQRYYTNTRGFNVFGFLGKNIFYYTEFYENQSYFVPFVDEKVEKTLVANGQGVWKIFGADQKGKDYNYASGFVWWKINRNFSLSAGQYKLFYGWGYRSLLLSDVASPYPFVRLDFSNKLLHYSNIYAENENFRTKYYFVHHKKHTTLNILNFRPLKHLEIGFFEAIVWYTSDNKTFRNRFPALFFAPIPILRPLVYGLNNQNNVLLGLNGRYESRFVAVYGQFVLDDFSKDNFYKRYGYQLGLKLKDLLFEYNKDVYFWGQIEYNQARPFTYSSNWENMSYSHLNEPLGHILGADFKEFLLIGRLGYKIFFFTLKYTNALTSIDTYLSNNGSNILLLNNTSTNTNPTKIAQRLPSKISTLSAQLSVKINNVNHLELFVEIFRRNFLNNFSQKKDLYFTFGIQNTIKNTYKDF